MSTVPSLRGSCLPGLASFRAYREALTIAAQVRTLGLSGHLRDQLLRACDSVVLNLAEGACDNSRAMKTRSFAIARASLWEAAAALDLAALSGFDVASISTTIAELDRALRPLARRR